MNKNNIEDNIFGLGWYNLPAAIGRDSLPIVVYGNRNGLQICNVLG